MSATASRSGGPEVSLLDPVDPQIPAGSHVGWVLSDMGSFAPVARKLAQAGIEHGERVTTFSAPDAVWVDGVRDLASLHADPAVDFLEGGALVPDMMFTSFRRESELARSEGHRGLRVLADMAWLLPTGASMEDTVRFELLLDRVHRELGATLICVYPESAFPDAVGQAACAVHPVVASAFPPSFRLVAGGQGTWHLSGELDLCSARVFTTALDAAASVAGSKLDMSKLRFIDIGNLREIARRCDTAGLSLIDPPAVVRKVWKVAGLEEIRQLDEVTVQD